MAFKFNFGEGEQPPTSAVTKPLRPGRLVSLNEAHKEFTKDDEEDVVTPSGQRLRKYRLRAQHLGRFPELRPVIQRSDLEPAVYEGGFKLWECSLDLVDWLATQERLSGMRVLELGCGHGLPGLWCLSQDASVDFADYNDEVLTALTIPNVHLAAPSAIDRCRFIAGDWSFLSDLVPSASYNIILCSEVLYFVSAYTKLLDLLKRCLHPTGKVLIASKLYYFSCGGGTRQFEELVEKGGTMTSTVVKHIEDQQSNIREILQLQFKRTAQ